VQLTECQPSSHAVAVLTVLARALTAADTSWWKRWSAPFIQTNIAADMPYNPAKYRYSHYLAASLIQLHWRAAKGTAVQRNAEFWAQLIYDSEATGEASNGLQLRYWQSVCREIEAKLPPHKSRRQRILSSGDPRMARSDAAAVGQKLDQSVRTLTPEEARAGNEDQIADRARPKTNLLAPNLAFATGVALAPMSLNNTPAASTLHPICDPKACNEIRSRPQLGSANAIEPDADLPCTDRSVPVDVPRLDLSLVPNVAFAIGKTSAAQSRVGVGSGSDAARDARNFQVAPIGKSPRPVPRSSVGGSVPSTLPLHSARESPHLSPAQSTPQSSASNGMKDQTPPISSSQILGPVPAYGPVSPRYFLPRQTMTATPPQIHADLSPRYFLPRQTSSAAQPPMHTDRSPRYFVPRQTSSAAQPPMHTDRSPRYFVPRQTRSAASPPMHADLSPRITNAAHSVVSGASSGKVAAKPSTWTPRLVPAPTLASASEASGYYLTV
jgi:hypothetical protein